MATKFTYSRLFGDDIKPSIRTKLEERQRLNHGVEFGTSVENYKSDFEKKLMQASD